MKTVTLFGKTYSLLFLSKTSFRFFETNAPKSWSVDSAALPPCVDFIEGGDRYVAENEGISITLFKNGQLEVSFQGSIVSRSILTGPGMQEAGDSLAEKEGHRSNDGLGYAGGLCIENDRPVYGLGEKTGPLDKRGYSYINWNTDDPSAHVDTFPSLYQSIPFFLLFDKDKSVGCFFDNTSKTRFDFNKNSSRFVFYEYESGTLDFYFFLGSLKQVIADFSALTGRNPLPPYWALGNQQSRWSYPSKAKVEEVIEGYKQAGLPLSVVYLDIDYMDSYKDFTVDGNKFSDISGWLSWLLEQDIHIVPIIDAGVKAEPGYFLFDEGIEQGLFSTLNGEVYHNEVWPGDSVFPSFAKEETRKWWAKHIASFLNLGFSGIWNDMNEPASFKGPLPNDVDMGGLPHSEAHNVYGHLMCKAGAEGFEMAGNRLFQLTRAGYAGTCRYSGTWAGDNQSIYDHLRLMFPQLMNMSLSGQGYIGADVGGFGGDATPELLAKWAIAAIFNPLFRNHSAIGTKDQEPYLLNGVYREAYAKALDLRYQLLPYLYDELYRHETSGTCVLRPLVYNYPDDERTYDENTEMMLGDALLIAPSFFPGQTKRSIYFPSDFYDIVTGKLYRKGDHIIDVSLPDLPVFAAKEALFMISSCRKAVRDDTLRIVAGGRKATYYHYEDAGDGLGYRNGEYNLFKIEFNPKTGASISYVHHGLPSRYHSASIRRLDEGAVSTVDFNFD